MDEANLQEQLERIDTLLHGLVEVTNGLQVVDSFPTARAMSLNADMASLKIIRASVARQIYHRY